ncbi:serine/threonine-protein phosphatase BSL1 [Artemisia annua]|uniref:Serine/threonine-protein phosphatase BSL1 n=1 Tax=Artemisia annua TaxID=35608 RepID=A0A2U1LYB7_ARTAN|nr:serine/threonine-protein phosphatase BSL1 [Artemisia annua]
MRAKERSGGDAGGRTVMPMQIVATRQGFSRRLMQRTRLMMYSYTLQRLEAGEPPSPRAAHAAAAVGTMVLFQGGIGPAGHSTDDLYVLDMSNDKYKCPRDTMTMVAFGSIDGGNRRWRRLAQQWQVVAMNDCGRMVVDTGISTSKNVIGGNIASGEVFYLEHVRKVKKKGHYCL